MFGPLNGMSQGWRQRAEEQGVGRLCGAAGSGTGWFLGELGRCCWAAVFLSWEAGGTPRALHPADSVVQLGQAAACRTGSWAVTCSGLGWTCKARR